MELGVFPQKHCIYVCVCVCVESGIPACSLSEIRIVSLRYLSLNQKLCGVSGFKYLIFFFQETGDH